MNRVLQRLYDLAPVPLQNGLLSAHSAWLHRKRYMGAFPRFRDLFVQYEDRSIEELQEYRDRALTGLVSHACRTVPYYRRLFRRLGLADTDVQRAEDLRKLPVLTKEDIKKHFDDLISESFNPRRLARGHTSGTTGSPLEICYDRETIYATYAALDRQYRWAGCRLARGGDRIAILRGNVIVPISNGRPPFWRYNRFHNHLLMSSFHLRPDNLRHYFDELTRFRPIALDGYPSNLYVLAKHLKNNGRTFPVRAVLTSSETLYDFQRETIEESFQCRVFDYYGLAERVVFAAECASHEGHHLCEEYGITEVLDGNLDPVQAGTPGKLVATSLHNRAMPLIRYVTNDITAIRTDPCSCGRVHTMMDAVTTKAEDLLTLKDGRLMSPSALTHPFKPLDSVAESQIVQKETDLVLVRIVRGEGYSDADTRHLVSGLSERLGAGTRIEIEFVREIPRSSSGKFRWVISEVPLGI